MKSTSPRLRVFIDSNIIMENTILHLGIIGLIELTACDYIKKEVNEVVKRKFPESTHKVKEILDTLKTIKTQENKKALNIIRDPKDAPILATVLKYKPDYFITGDKDFHTKEIKNKIKVVTTKQFLKEYTKK
ncbi:MAG: putative toxin-antitoxin system toxin component, PIN family [Candidatus Altiarchaeales archaeon ex4484_2]|nr:MAG: putative toxin-antitoxin system toxin component, PIN family [Candidatus Altiarchaeales archaeon ex4484_2]